MHLTLMALALGAMPAAPPHWAFQPVAVPPLPQVHNSAWVRNPIDAFIAVRHDRARLVPSPEASRRVLVRRLSLDLTGLAPTPEEISAFETDPAADAYERLVARLLASPAHGERWARHWLDIVRWAESEGYESNHPRPFAWRYRDYVVASLNADKPYDRFVREQLAGDELLPYSDENLIATGFLAAARLSSNEEDKALQRNDVLVDIVNATGGALLGLTFHCAQCHDHKFDPLTARDYYRFQGFFLKGQPANLALQNPALWSAYEAARPPEYEPARKQQQTLFEAARARLIEDAKKTLTPELREALAVPSEQRTPAQEKLAREADLLFQFTPQRIEKAISDADRQRYEALKKTLETLEQRMPERPQTFGYYSPVTARMPIEVLPMKGFYPLPYVPAELARVKPYVLVQGDVHRRGAEVDVSWPALFGPAPPATVSQQPRTTLADWLTRPDHPLTARVLVNRLWQYHFGGGLVATPNDFGLKGAAPTHPELLDWLAAELVRSGWSIKHIHRLIVGSATYRQASRPHASNSVIDPDNLLWWRWTPRRLEAEALRDSQLAVSGDLVRASLGGASDTEEAKSRRRSLYLFQKRDLPPQVQALFDGPTAAAESCPKRHVSTGPLQALYLLNNDFVRERAQSLAKRVRSLAGTERDRQIDLAFTLTLGRLPDTDDRADAERLFAAFGAAAVDQALTSLCQALLNVNEFVYLD